MGRKGILGQRGVGGTRAGLGLLLPSVKALWIFISHNLYLSKPAHMPGQQSLTPGEVFGWNSRRQAPRYSPFLAWTGDAAFGTY